MYQRQPSLNEFREIERLDRILMHLAQRADSGPRSLAHAALLAGMSDQRVH